MKEPDAHTDKLAKLIVDAAFCVHKNLGPGLLESVYEECFCYELAKRNIKFERQVLIPIIYDKVELKTNLRIDVLVENTIIVEIKAVEEHNPLYEAQIITYLKLVKKELGFLINFNVSVIRRGIRRIIYSI